MASSSTPISRPSPYTSSRGVNQSGRALVVIRNRMSSPSTSIERSSSASSVPAQRPERPEDRAAERLRARVDRSDGRHLLRLAREFRSDRGEQLVELHREQSDVARGMRRPEPRNRPCLSLRPLARESRLPVAGGSSEEGDARTSSFLQP